MSEEQQEGGLSAIKKTLIGVVTTAVTGAGVYVTTNINKIFGVEEEEATKTEMVQPAPAAAAPPVVVNLTNNNTQQQSNSGGSTTIIKETIREVPAQQPSAQPVAVEPKKETTAERIARLKAEKEGGK